MEAFLSFIIEHMRAVAVILSLATIVPMLAPRFLPAASRARASAGISANWLLAPPAVMLLALIQMDTSDWGGSAMGGAVFMFLVVEIGLGTAIIYRHRQWPWAAAAIFAIAMAWSLGMIVLVGLSQIPYY
jgi:hypothetical protein